jgi:hypothetical protein
MLTSTYIKQCLLSNVAHYYAPQPLVNMVHTLLLRAHYRPTDIAAGARARGSGSGEAVLVLPALALAPAGASPAPSPPTPVLTAQPTATQAPTVPVTPAPTVAGCTALGTACNASSPSFVGCCGGTCSAAGVCTAPTPAPTAGNGLQLPVPVPGAAVSQFSSQQDDM